MGFPTLSRPPTYPLQETYEDPVIRTNFESGYVLTRLRFTRSRRKFVVNYEQLNTSDINSLINFYKGSESNFGATSFVWSHPISGTNISVRFSSPPQIETTHYDGSTYRYKVTINLEEV